MIEKGWKLRFLPPLKLTSLFFILDIIMAILIIVTLGALAHFQVYNAGININDYWISFAMSFYKIVSGYYLFLYIYFIFYKSTIRNFHFLSTLIIIIICYFFSTAIMAMMGKSSNWITAYINAFKFSPPYIVYIGLSASLFSLFFIKIIKKGAEIKGIRLD